MVHWEADHVLAHSSGGRDDAANYLPAHNLCNNYRWNYSPEEFQWILKIGVWARKQMEGQSELGLHMLQAFHGYDRRRERRRRSAQHGRPPDTPVERTSGEADRRGDAVPHRAGRSAARR